MKSVFSCLIITMTITAGISASAQDNALSAQSVKTEATQTRAIEEPPLPEISTGPSITLAKALEKAISQNLDLSSARLEIEKARAGLSGAWGGILPIVQAKMEYTHMDHDDQLDLANSMTSLLDAIGIALPPGTSLGNPMLINPQEKVVGSICAVLPLFNPEGWLHIRTAKQGVIVAELSIEQARRQILLGVAQAYFTVLTTQDLIAFYHSQVTATGEQLRVAEARLRAGRGMQIDVVRAQTDLEQANQSMLSALLAFDNARDTLGNLIGEDGLPLPVDKPTLAVPGGNIRELEQVALENRADLKTHRAAAELINRQRKSVWMQFIPRIDMAWRGSYQFTEMADLGSSDKSRWALMFSLTVPLYNHFRYAQLDEKRAALRQAELNLETTGRKGTLAVRTAGRNYTTSLAAVITAEKQAELAKEGQRLTESSYRNGTGTSLEVTQARQTFNAAGLNLATLQFKAQLALLSFLDAMGEELQDNIN